MTPGNGTAPIILTALFGAADFTLLDGLRRRHFPPERNAVPAHLTLFHHLPPTAAREILDVMKAIVRDRPAPAATLAGLIRMEQGVAFRVDSLALADMREDVADHFHGLLVAQDQQGWRAHVTIQNKADPKDAAALYQAMKAAFRPRPLTIAGLAAWWYRGGPWEALGEARFR